MSIASQGGSGALSMADATAVMAQAASPKAKRQATAARVSPTRFLPHTQSPQRQALTVDVSSPVARQLMVHTPPLAVHEPQAGCSVEELRIFVLKQLKVVKADSTDLEVRAAARINEVQGKVDDLAARTNAVLNDVGVFGVIKNYVTETTPQAKMDKVDHDLKVLQAQGNDFVALLDGHLIQIEGIEQEFKGHVETIFMRVETECNVIKTALEGVSASGGTSNGLVAQRVVAIELAMQKEVATINGNLQQLKSGIEAVPLLISSAVGAIAPAKCHCVHVDQLDSRVAMLEAAANAATVRPDVWQGGTDPWRLGHAASSTPAPIRMPPGMSSASGGPGGGGDGRGGHGGGGAPILRPSS